jgi:hypothetical protein
LRNFSPGYVSNGTRSFRDVGSIVRFARKRTRLGGFTSTRPRKNLAPVDRSPLASEAAASNLIVVVEPTIWTSTSLRDRYRNASQHGQSKNELTHKLFLFVGHDCPCRRDRRLSVNNRGCDHIDQLALPKQAAGVLAGPLASRPIFLKKRDRRPAHSRSSRQSP